MQANLAESQKKITDDWLDSTGMTSLPPPSTDYVYSVTAKRTGLTVEGFDTTRSAIPYGFHPGLYKKPKMEISPETSNLNAEKVRIEREIRYALQIQMNKKQVLNETIDSIEKMIIEQNKLLLELDDKLPSIPQFGGSNDILDDVILLLEALLNKDSSSELTEMDEPKETIEEVENYVKYNLELIDELDKELNDKTKLLKENKIRGNVITANIRVQEANLNELRKRLTSASQDIEVIKQNAYQLQDSLQKLNKLNVMYGDLPPPGSPTFGDVLYKKFENDVRYKSAKIPQDSEYLSGCKQNNVIDIKREAKPFQNLIAKLLGPGYAFNQIAAAGVGSGKTYGATLGILSHMMLIYDGKITANSVDHIVIGVPTLYHCFNPWIEEFNKTAQRPLENNFKLTVTEFRKPWSYIDKSRHISVTLRLYKGTSSLTDSKTVEIIVTLLPYQQMKQMDTVWLNNLQPNNRGGKLGKRQFLLIVDEAHYIISLWLNNNLHNLCSNTFLTVSGDPQMIYDMTERDSCVSFQKFVKNIMNSKSQIGRLLLLSATPFSDSESIAFGLSLLRPRYCGESGDLPCDQVTANQVESFFMKNAQEEWIFNKEKTIPWLNMLSGYLSYYSLSSDWRYYPRYDSEQGYNKERLNTYYVYHKETQKFWAFKRKLSDSEYNALLTNNLFEVPYICIWVPRSVFVENSSNVFRPPNMGNPSDNYHNLKFPNDLENITSICNKQTYNLTTQPEERWKIEQRRPPTKMAEIINSFMKQITNGNARWIIYHGDSGYLLQVAREWGKISGYKEIGISANNVVMGGSKTFQVITRETTVQIHAEARQSLQTDYIKQSSILFTDILEGVDFSDFANQLSLQHVHPVFKKQLHGRQLRNCSLESGNQRARSFLLTDIYPNIAENKVYKTENGTLEIEMPKPEFLNTLDFSQNYYFSKFKAIQNEMINASFDCKLNKDYHNSQPSEIKNWSDLSTSEIKCLTFDTQDPACIPSEGIIKPENFGPNAFSSCTSSSNVQRFKSPKGLTYTVEDARRHDFLNKKKNPTSQESYEKAKYDAIIKQLSQSQSGYSKQIGQSLENIKRLSVKYKNDT
jgi:hypothetical protein